MGKPSKWGIGPDNTQMNSKWGIGPDNTQMNTQVVPPNQWATPLPGKRPPPQPDSGKGGPPDSAQNNSDRPPLKKQKAFDTKLFVGGLPKQVNPETVRSYFMQFGHVREVDLKYASTGEFRRFGFVTFDSLDAAQAVLDNGTKNKIDGKWIDCRCAGDEQSQSMG